MQFSLPLLLQDQADQGNYLSCSLILFFHWVCWVNRWKRGTTMSKYLQSHPNLVSMNIWSAWQNGPSYDKEVNHTVLLPPEDLKTSCFCFTDFETQRWRIGWGKHYEDVHAQSSFETFLENQGGETFNGFKMLVLLSLFFLKTLQLTFYSRHLSPI